MTESDGAPESIVVIGPEGKPLIVPANAGRGGESVEFTGQVVGDENPGESGEKEESLADMVEQPAKVMRIGTMIKQLLEEVRHAPLDDASRTRLREIHKTSIRELEQGLAPELREELERLALPFSDDVIPSDAELRIAQAQLVGWLEGLFHGIQTALFAQQMAARAQLEQMRHALPSGASTIDPQGHAGPATGGGQYL
ncbi:bacterial proteasome activator family protein [Nocardia sp. NPDC005978]|uniref:bacterial proteasome activator family protein n=1 Tax=unclassified Nocardia TaxID=2637762 RepID=UPI0033B378E3